jgi:hypothetical protein
VDVKKLRVLQQGCFKKLHEVMLDAVTSGNMHKLATHYLLLTAALESKTHLPSSFRALLEPVGLHLPGTHLSLYLPPLPLSLSISLCLPSN